MAVEGDIRTVLNSLAVGGCHRGIASAGVLKPYITFKIISYVPLVTLDGRNGKENKRIQIDLWDDDIYGYSRLEPLKTLVNSAMDAASFTNCPLPSVGDGYEEETKMNKITMDYSIWS